MTALVVNLLSCIPISITRQTALQIHIGFLSRADLTGKKSGQFLASSANPGFRNHQTALVPSHWKDQDGGTAGGASVPEPAPAKFCGGGRNKGI